MTRNRLDILTDLASYGDVRTNYCFLCGTNGTNASIDIVELCSSCHRRFQLLKELEYSS